MKSYYSCLDCASVRQVPQPLQHLAIADKADKLGGTVVFYTAEEFETLASQEIMRIKIGESPEVAGIIFFTLRQFGYGDGLNLEFLNSILQDSYEVHFAREDLSITNLAELDSCFPLLFAYDHVSRRDEEMPFEQRLEQLGTVENVRNNGTSLGAR